MAGYQQPYYYPQPRQGCGGKILAAAVIALILGAALAYAFTYSTYSSALAREAAARREAEERLKALQSEVQSLRERLGEEQKRYAQLEEKYRLLLANYTRLKQEYARLLSQEAESEADINETLRQLKEVLYYRIFTLYNYRADEYYYAYYRVWSYDYLYYRLNPRIHVYASLENRFVPENIYNATTSFHDPHSAVIDEIASDLHDISRGDPELYANLALQLVHQLYYNITGYTKYPVETLVEGSGDCDNLAVLLASILAAGGYDTLVLLVQVDTPQGPQGHAMAAVALPEPPRDLYSHGRDAAYYYEYNGRRFYLLEATWPRPGDPDYIDPYMPDALALPGAFVGDNPWGDSLRIIDVIYIPGAHG